MHASSTTATVVTASLEPTLSAGVSQGNLPQIALDLAQKNLQAEQRKLELGSETLFVLLETQTELSQVEQSLIQAQVNYQIAVASVYYSTGELLGNYNVEIASWSK